MNIYVTYRHGQGRRNFGRQYVDIHIRNKKESDCKNICIGYIVNGRFFPNEQRYNEIANLLIKVEYKIRRLEEVRGLLVDFASAMDGYTTVDEFVDLYSCLNDAQEFEDNYTEKFNEYKEDNE